LIQQNGAVMHNFFTIEVEVELMRQERERAAAAEARAVQARPESRNARWMSRVSRSLASRPALALPSMPVGAPLELRRVPRPVEC
jgi:hypothetical protein